MPPRGRIPFSEETGPTALLNGAKTPIDIFKKFVGDSFFRDITEASNDYAKLKGLYIIFSKLICISINFNFLLICLQYLFDIICREREGG